jgi:hypothetical protein
MMKIMFEDNHDLGFVLWCLASEAISMGEFHEWILYVIETVDNPPAYIFDLLDFKGYMANIHPIVGFTPDWSPTDSEIKAISGIALRRGIIPYEPVDPTSCAEALAANPAIQSKFEEMFLFISIPANQPLHRTLNRAREP